MGSHLSHMAASTRSDSHMAASTSSDYLLLPGASIPAGYEPFYTWEEGIEAAKALGYSGDAVAHGAYGAYDPNACGDRRPKGMYRASEHGRFHFNCGVGGGAVGNDKILVRRKGLRKAGKRLRLEDIPVPSRATPVNDSSPVLDAAASCQKWCEAGSLKEAIRSGDTVLLKGTWISRHSKRGGILPRRQDLPDEAKWPAEELCARLGETQSIWDWEGRVPLVALSYCWENSSHPDPRGEQLARVAAVINICIEGLSGKKQYPWYVCDDIGMFWDYASLYQGEDRSQEEKESFQRGLQNVNLWYGHQLTTVWMLTRVPDGVKPYTQRGWPCFERCLSEQITPRSFALDLGRQPNNFNDRYWELVDKCGAGRQPPVRPVDFDEVCDRSTFTNGSDRDFVKKKYEKSYREIMGSAKELFYDFSRWGPGQYEALAKVLPSCYSLETLHLNGNSAGNAGAEAIAAVLHCTTITRLEMCGNDLDARGVGVLMIAADALPWKCTLFVGSNPVQSDDRDVLNELFPNCLVVW